MEVSVSKSNIQNFGFFTLLGLVIWPVLSTVGPKIEGRLNPVVVSTELTRIIPESENTSKIYGTATKLRECSYLKTEWYYGKPGEQSVLVPVTINEPAKIRYDGKFAFGPWVLELSHDHVRDESYALVYHQCHILWPTITRFWP